MTAGGIGRPFARGVVTSQEWEAQDLAQRSRSRGVQLIANCPPGTREAVSGLVRSIKVFPLDDVLSFEADLYDGTGRVSLVWLGRYRIAGIRAGSEVEARGRLIRYRNRLVIFNPAYELISRQPSSGAP